MNETVAAPEQSVQSRSLPDVLLLGVFLLFFYLQLWHHQMWRDELNAWGIAVGSPTLRALFHNIHYEGHPSLWYLLLWIPARWTSDPAAMKAVQAVIGTAIYLLIGLRSPFSRLETILLYLCYFISFEYTVLSRTYGLCLLVLLVYLRSRGRHPERVALNAVLLGIMANTDVLGVFLSGGLFVEYAWDRFQPFSRSRSRDVSRGLGWAAGIYALSVILCYATLRPAPDISWRTTGHIFGTARSFRIFADAVVSYVVLPWFPIAFGKGHWWNPLAFEHFYFYFLLSLLIIPAIWWTFRREPRLLWMLALTATVAILFAHLVYFGSERHYGVVFLSFLAACWLLRERTPALPPLALLLLTLTAIGGVQAAADSWQRPFSTAGAAARWLRDHPAVGHLPLVGTPDTSVAGVAEEARRSIYFLDCSCSDHFLRFSNRRDDFSIAQIPARLVIAAHDLQAPEMVFITVSPLSATESAAIAGNGFAITPLARFPKAEGIEEDYFLYKLTRTT